MVTSKTLAAWIKDTDGFTSQGLLVESRRHRINQIRDRLYEADIFGLALIGKFRNLKHALDAFREAHDGRQDKEILCDLLGCTDSLFDKIYDAYYGDGFNLSTARTSAYIVRALEFGAF